MKFGEFMRLKRLELEMSLRTLAKLTDIDVAYLSRIERGGKPPEKTEIVKKLINALNLSSDDAQRFQDFAALENKEFPTDIEIDPTNYEAIPILLRTISNKKLTPEEIIELTKRINEK